MDKEVEKALKAAELSIDAQWPHYPELHYQRNVLADEVHRLRAQIEELQNERSSELYVSSSVGNRTK